MILFNARHIGAITLALAFSSGCALKSYDDSIYDNRQRLSQTLTQDAQGWTLYPDGSRYLGPLQDARPHGQGTLINADGNRYEGNFVEGKLLGSADIQFANGDRYKGTYANQQPHGEGDYQHADGTVRSGRFRQGELIKGTWIDSNGQQRKGLFMKGELNDPEGELTQSDGSVFSGPFVAGSREGLLVVTLPSGQDQYRIYANDQLEYTTLGPKTLAQLTPAAPQCAAAGFPPMRLLQGDCNANGPNGPAILYSPQEEFLLQGEFQQGMLIEGSRFALNGNLQWGSWQNQQLHGDGSLYENAKLVYQGGFQQGQRHGTGICIVKQAPEECAFFEGARVDSAFLAQGFNQELRALKQSHQKALNKIRAETRKQRARFEEDFQRRVRSLERKIERAEQQAFTQGMIGTTNALMQGATDSQARAVAQQYLDEAERIKQQVAREKESHARSLASEEQRWLAQQQQKIQQANQQLEKQQQALIASHKTRCETIPGKQWVSGENLCI